jgi:excisionase family DNA binding protein
MEKYLSFTEIAELLGIPARTVYHLNQAGDGPKAVRVGRAFRVAQSDLESWLKNNSSE